jgi:type IV secretory pathway TrbD component
VLFLGVEQPVAMLEAILIFALLVGIGLHAMTIVLAVVIAVVLHPTMAWVTAKDAHATRVYARSVTLKDYYPAHGRMHSAPSVHPSIPVIS